jgi:uncharacterized protein YraI
MRVFLAKIAVKRAFHAVLERYTNRSNGAELMPRSQAVLLAAVIACGASCRTQASFDLPTAPRRNGSDRLQTRWLVAQGPVDPEKPARVPRIGVDEQGGPQNNPIDPVQPGGTRECRFLLDSCKDTSVLANLPSPPKDAKPPRACAQPVGSHVIVNVPWQDSDNGLLLRAAPNMRAAVLSVIPANAVGLIVSACSDGWCEIEYNCQKGYAGSKYVADRKSQFRNVSGVSSTDPDGLNIRSGPGASFPKVRSIPYNGKQVIVHNCQQISNASWCLITYENNSGWVSARYLSF